MHIRTDKIVVLLLALLFVLLFLDWVSQFIFFALSLESS